MPKFPVAEVAGSGQRLYLITFGHLLQSQDGGNRWASKSVVPGGSPNLLHLTAGATSPLTAWVATRNMEDGGVYRTTDGGENWSLANTGLPGEGQIYDFYTAVGKADLVYIRIGPEIYKSIDAGASWQLQSTLPGFASNVGRSFHINIAEPNIWYYAADASPGSTVARIYRSSNEGQSWQGVGSIRVKESAQDNNENAIFAIASSPEDPDLVFASQYGGLIRSENTEVGVYRSTDGGDTFEIVTTASASEISVDLRGIVLLRPSIAIFDYFRSADDGDSFTRLSIEEGVAGSINASFDYSRPGVVYTGNIRGPHISTNSGLTWTPIWNEVQGTLDTSDIELAVPEGDISFSWEVPLEFNENASWEASYSASLSSNGWVEIANPNGIIPDVLELQISTAGLAAGSYTSTLSIECGFQCAGNPLEVAIHLNIIDPSTQTPPEYDITSVVGDPEGELFQEGVPGLETAARPLFMDLDEQERLLFIDTDFVRVRRLNLDGTVETLGGNGVRAETADGQPALGNPMDAGVIASDKNGGYWIRDGGPIDLRHIGADGLIQTVGDLGFFEAIDTDEEGNLYMYDNELFMLDLEGNRTDVPGGDFDFGDVNQIEVAPSGSVFVSTAQHRVFELMPSGSVRLVAGTGEAGFNYDGVTGVLAQLNNPRGMTIDQAGNLFIAEATSDRIRMVDTNGIIHTVIGPGDGTEESPGVDFPFDVAVTRRGEIYVADRSNDLIRLLTPRGPTIREEAGITNAASFEEHFSPGSLLSVFGTFEGVAFGTAPDFPWPTMLNGVRVTLNGRDMPLSFTSDGQINAQIPYETELGTAVLVVYVNGIASASRQIQIDAASPGILAFGSNRAVAVNLAGTDNPYEINTDSTPVDPGGYVVVYLIGMGVPSSPVATGEVAPEEPLITPATQPVTVMIGDRTVPFDFLGLTPGWVGLVQLNLPIPADLADGDYPVKVTIGDKSSNTPVITVRQ